MEREGKIIRESGETQHRTLLLRLEAVFPSSPWGGGASPHPMTLSLANETLVGVALPKGCWALVQPSRFCCTFAIPAPRAGLCLPPFPARMGYRWRRATWLGPIWISWLLENPRHLSYTFIGVCHWCSVFACYPAFLEQMLTHTANSLCLLKSPLGRMKYVKCWCLT